MTNRKFGIEIECVGADAGSTIEALSALNIRCVSYLGNYAAAHTNVPTWKIVPDGSVRTGWELVSPILSGEDGIASVRQIARVLTEQGANATPQCGLHVHVDARDLSLNSIVNVARRYAHFENEINAFMPRARNQNQYCRSLSGMNFDRLIRDGMDNLRHFDRYHKVNLAAYARHSTIEFRQHSGTVSGEKMENWIRFCTAFVEASIVAPSTEAVAVTAPVVAAVTSTNFGAEIRAMAHEMHLSDGNATEERYANWIRDYINHPGSQGGIRIRFCGNDSLQDRAQDLIRRARAAAQTAARVAVSDSEIRNMATEMFNADRCQTVAPEVGVGTGSVWLPI